MSNENTRSNTAIKRQKRLYSAPKLVDYGSVSQLTLAKEFGGNDGNTKCVGEGAQLQCNAGTS